MNKNTIGFGVIAALLIVTGIFSVNVFFSENRTHDKVNIRDFPLLLNGWEGREIGLTKKEIAILGTENLLFREYQNIAGKKASLLIVYSETNRAIFHPPEGCLIGSGECITEKTPVEVTSGSNRFTANKVAVEKDGAKEIMLYSYKVRGLYTDNYYLQQAHFAYNQLIGRRADGAIVRVTMGVSDSEKETLATLKEFLGVVVARVDEMTGGGS